MTVQERIAELRRLHEEATAGPWETIGRFVRRGIVVQANKGKADICDCYPDAEISRNESDINSAFIAATRNLLPVLLAAWEVAAAVEKTERARIDYHACCPADDDRKLATFDKAVSSEEAARKSYREALKGVEDE